MSWRPVLGLCDLPQSTPTAVALDGRQLCLVRLGERIFAFDDACPHRQWPLHAGRLRGAVLECRAHTWEWDVRDGSLQRIRAPECLTMHAARVRGGAVEVRLDPRAPAPLTLSPLWRRVQLGAVSAGG